MCIRFQTGNTYTFFIPKILQKCYYYLHSLISYQLPSLLEITDTHLHDDIAEEYGIKNICADRFTLRGFISSCEHGSGRSTTDRQFYYINSRPCEPTKVRSYFDIFVDLFFYAHLSKFWIFRL